MLVCNLGSLLSSMQLIASLTIIILGTHVSAGISSLSAQANWLRMQWTWVRIPLHHTYTYTQAALYIRTER